jgi:hypothetical protein
MKDVIRGRLTEIFQQCSGGSGRGCFRLDATVCRVDGRVVLLRGRCEQHESVVQ